MTPRIIFIYWMQGWNVSGRGADLAKRAALSWLVNNPGWTVVRISDRNLASWLGPDEMPALKLDLTAQARSDVVRIAMLAKYGGVWVDATLMAAAPLRNWLNTSAGSPNGRPRMSAFRYPRAGMQLCTWLIAAPARDVIIQRWKAAVNKFWAKTNPHKKFNYFWVHELFNGLYEHDHEIHRLWGRVGSKFDTGLRCSVGVCGKLKTGNIASYKLFKCNPLKNKKCAMYCQAVRNDQDKAVKKWSAAPSVVNKSKTKTPWKWLEKRYVEDDYAEAVLKLD